ncbi:MAG: 1-acyl-sn-glycerol-3-phosphate acyltransferase [Clostridia bacterium]|nr:1-acyl-sn-glycerol-3-phosphate acyltransferase [Clostridia bacterium]MBQ9409117.1 1-acyl-sn-glycerol-3-phosphate acyltransferase [Clostridia bacterium]
MVNSFFRIISWIYGHIFHRIKVSGMENVPADAPYVMAVNHTSFRDPVVMASFLKWDASAMAKKELFDSKLLGWIMRGVHAIPVDREAGDMASLRACLNFLKEGHGLVIFPEGHRFHDGKIHEFKTGVSFIAMRAGVPLIPARIHTSYRPFAKITVNIGKPIVYGKLTGADALNGVTEQLRKAVENL